jgi:hypothetical protein
MFKSIRLFPLFAGLSMASAVLAGTIDIALPVRTKPGESYPALLARASKLAGDTIERRFQENVASDRVNLFVTAENQGEIAPIFAVNVSRQEWAGNPNIQRWARVFPLAKDLLGFGIPVPAPSAVSPAPPSPAAEPIPPAAPGTAPASPTPPIGAIPEAPPPPRSLPGERLNPAPAGP